MNIDECYYLGYTSKVHGKEGEIIIKLDVDFPEEYKKLESVLIQLNKTDNSLIPFFISNTHLNNNDSIRVKIDDINTVDEAKALIGKEIYLPLSSLPKLTGNKFYYHEVINFKVTDTNLGEIGSITKILDYPTQAIFEITNPQGNEILVPIIDEVIVSVDRENKNITVTTPEGLVELYLE